MRGSEIFRQNSRILVVGSRARAERIITALRSNKEKLEIVGCLDPDSSQIGKSVADVKVVGTVSSLPEYLFGQAVDLVLFAMSLEAVPNAKELIGAALQTGVPVSIVLDGDLKQLEEHLNGHKITFKKLAGMTMVVMSTVPCNRTYLILKRLLDVTAAASLLIVLSPLFIVIALLIKLSSAQGSVFYPWKVLGQNRNPFVGYKFRTMVPNAEQLKEQLLQHNEMQGPVFKMRNDPRITPLGSFLRKYSLDELPQLYSVLKGDMSLVGPRPPAKHEADQFEFWQRRKLGVKPGMTCLWQVNGRSEISSFDEWARLDLEYIRNASLWFDFQILLRTVPAVIRGRGAH
jgi:exopolysaccharide biosynthesis polyprenyl glycosylphosphotransferase